MKKKILYAAAVFTVGMGLILGVGLGEKKNNGTCEPGWKRPFPVDPAVYPFASRCFRWQGNVMHYLDEKPRGEVKGTVLMIHGNAVWSVIYRKMINPLKEMGFRVIAVDLLGFGMSDKPSLEEFDFMPGTQAKIMGDFIREMDLRDIYLAGQDWGGPIGLDAAASMPERINGILLMNTWAWELGPVAPGKTNPMHVVHDRGVDALANPDKYWQGLLIRGGATGLARRNAKKGSGKYEALKNAVLFPYFDRETGKLRSPESAAPFVVFARATVTDYRFLKNLRKKMKKLYSKPVFFIFGDDTAFGPLKTDLSSFGKRAVCPEGYKSASENPDYKTNCVSEKTGETVWPVVDRFLEKWDSEKIVGVRKEPNHGHWLQDEIPLKAAQAVKALYTFQKR